MRLGRRFAAHLLAPLRWQGRPRIADAVHRVENIDSIETSTGLASEWLGREFYFVVKRFCRRSVTVAAPWTHLFVHWTKPTTDGPIKENVASLCVDYDTDDPFLLRPHGHSFQEGEPQRTQLQQHCVRRHMSSMHLWLRFAEETVGGEMDALTNGLKRRSFSVCAFLLERLRLGRSDCMCTWTVLSFRCWNNRWNNLT